MMMFHFRSVFLNPDYMEVLSNMQTSLKSICVLQFKLLRLDYIVITARRSTAEY